MGMEWENLTEEQLCDLMCGKSEEDTEDESTKGSQTVDNCKR